MGVVTRGDICWAELADPTGAGPGFRRPTLIVSSDRFNRSRINTVVVAAITSNQRLAAAPGNVALTRGTAGLGKASVVNVSALLTLDRATLSDPIGALPLEFMHQVDRGLRLVLGL